MEIAKAIQCGYKAVTGAASQFGTASKATCITVQDEDKLRIDLDKLREILIRPEIGDAPIVIISIAGEMRTGKSFIMNYFAKRLNNMKNKNWMSDDINAGWSDKIFHWRAGTERETTGINIANQIYSVIGKNGIKVVVLLVDTQGLFDNKTPEDVNKTLLTLSTLMSSVQIFNLMGHVNAQHLRNLKTCVDFAISTAKDKAPYFKLQDLMFLVRDGKEEDDQSHGEDFGFKRGQKYIDKIIESDDGGSEQIEIRKRIKDSFNTVRCFIMPHPGLPATKRNFSGNTAETDIDFQKRVKEFVEEVLDPKNLVPKRKGGEEGNYMTGRELLNLIGAFDSIFASKLFAVNDMMQANTKAYYASKCEEALLQYDGHTRESKINMLLWSRPANTRTSLVSSDNVKIDDELTKHHEKWKTVALNQFDLSVSMGNGKEKKFYREHLEKKCNEHFDSAVERWHAKQNDIRIKRSLKTAEIFAQYESEMRQLRSKEISREDSSLENLHKECLKVLIDQNASKIDVEELTNKAELHLKMLLKINAERRNLENKLLDEKRQRQLFGLSVRLQEKSLKLWSENLKKCLTDGEIEIQEQKITERLQRDYYMKALLPHEFEHLCILNNRMEEIYQQAVDAFRSKSHYEAKAKSSKAKNEKETLSSVVDKLVESYAEDLERDLHMSVAEDGMKSQKYERQKEKRQKFYDACSEHIRKYHTDFLSVLKKNCEEAKKRNEENKELQRENVTSFVDEMVLEAERHLEEIMSDRFIAKEKLCEVYDALKKKLTVSSAENMWLKFILIPTEEYMQIASEKIQFSLKKMEKKNEESKEAQMIVTRDFEELSGLWKRFIERIREFFSSRS